MDAWGFGGSGTRGDDVRMRNFRIAFMESVGFSSSFILNWKKRVEDNIMVDLDGPFVGVIDEVDAVTGKQSKEEWIKGSAD